MTPDRHVFHFITPVWGNAYIDRFLRIALTSQLAPGNLPAVLDHAETYHIVTDAAGYKRLKDDKAIRALGERLNVKLHEVVLRDVHSYVRLTDCFNHVLALETDPSCAFMFLNPDAIWSDGTFAFCQQCIENGYRAVCAAGLRVVEQDIQPWLDERLAGSDVLHASSRDLTKLFLDHQHPLTQAHVWTDNANFNLGHLYRIIPEEGLLARCFHVHPLMVWPEMPGQIVPDGQTLDHDYVRLTVSLPATYLITDSDELCCIEVSERDHLKEHAPPKALDINDHRAWAEQWTNGYHRRFGQTSLRMHAGPMTAERWDKEEQVLNRAISEILGPVTRSVAMPVYQNAIPSVTADQSPIGPSPDVPKPSLTQQTRRLAKAVLRRVLPARFLEMDQHARQVPELHWFIRHVEQQLHQHAGWVHEQFQKFQEQQSQAHAQLLNQALRGRASARANGHPAEERADLDAMLVPERPAAGDHDPTVDLPLGYGDIQLARQVYGSTFFRALSYLNGTGVQGDVYEFGTYRGYTTRKLAEAVLALGLPRVIHTFDSFKGFPRLSHDVDRQSYEVRDTAHWQPGEASAGEGTADRLRAAFEQAFPEMDIRVHAGFFEDSLRRVRKDSQCALLHIDCDLYNSARSVLDYFLGNHLLSDGAVILFDDWNCNRSRGDMGEQRALRDALATHPGWTTTPFFQYGWHGQAMFVHTNEPPYLA